MALGVEEAVIAILDRLVERSGGDFYSLEAPRPVIHAAFGRVHDEVPELFPKVGFGKYGALKNSEEIDYAWRGLVIEGLISTENPRLVTHRVKKTLHEIYGDEVDELIRTRDLESDLDRAANVFEEAVKDILANNRTKDLIVTR